MNLLDAEDFVEVAIAVCARSRELSVDECGVFLHAPSGRPLISVDTLADDDPRRSAALNTWYLDPILTAVRNQRAPAGDIVDGVHTLVLPIIDPRGLLGSVRCYRATSFSVGLHRDLEHLADHASIRLTDLGVTTGSAPALARLTARQQDVAQLAASGCTNVQIGDVLGLSENTVKKHLKDIFARLEVSNRTALAGVFAAIVPHGSHDQLPLGVTRRGDITISRSA